MLRNVNQQEGFEEILTFLKGFFTQTATQQIQGNTDSVCGQVKRCTAIHQDGQAGRKLTVTQPEDVVDR